MAAPLCFDELSSADSPQRVSSLRVLLRQVFVGIRDGLQYTEDKKMK